MALGARPEALPARGAARGRTGEAPALLGPSGGGTHTMAPLALGPTRAGSSAAARPRPGVGGGVSGGSPAGAGLTWRRSRGAERSGGGGGHRWERGALRDLRSGSGGSARREVRGRRAPGWGGAARRYAKCVTRRTATTPVEGRGAAERAW